MVYRVIEGRSLREGDPPLAGLLPERLGRFLHDLHTVPLEFLGLRSHGAEAWRQRYREQLDVFRARVMPLLGTAERAVAEAMFTGFLDEDAHFRFPDVLVHDDLGPAHILVKATGDLAGVIDWGDAGPGDPASDFAWILPHALGIGERALAAYGGSPDPTFRDRVRFYDALGPWYEVTHGLDTEQPNFVASGLVGVRERLLA
jgi:aminoglycoside phosphotransferase (APT) family kinase protein